MRTSGSRYLLCVSWLCGALAWLGPAPGALADNSPESAQRRVEQDYLPKLEAACGLTLAVQYDGASLRKHDLTIARDQTDGDSDCNEPLRYLWYVCNTPAGKAAVQAAHVARVVCKGTAAKTGSLTLKGGVITVERAAGEVRPFERSRKSFDVLLHVSVQLGQRGSEDPYYDQAWRELANQPNPTRSTSDYCLVNGQKQQFDAQLVYRMRGQDGRLRCWKNSQAVIDLTFRAGRKSGFTTEFSERGSFRESLRDDVRDGEQRTYEATRLKSVAFYARGEQVWSKQLGADGSVAEYSLKLARGSAGWKRDEAGHIYDLRCSPDVGREPLLRELCGFGVARTTPIYDGTKQVNRIETWQDGVLQSQAAGVSVYAERSSVAFKDGKKHGTERLLAADGKLQATITWDRGVKEGKESRYAEGGTKLVKEVLWSANEQRQVTELFLNGNRKLCEVYDRPEHRRVTTYWDTGQVASEGDQARCSRYGSRYWCEDGWQRAYFEDGTISAEGVYELGKRNGPQRTFWQNKRPASVEEYSDDRPVKSTRWDETGKLIADEAYEADGSRKIQR